jgi:hypothetical protein
MKNLKAFNQFINEDLTKDDKARLRELGLTNYSAPLEERYTELVEEWMDDPEVSTAINTLKAKFDELFAQHIDVNSDEDSNEINRIREHIYESYGIDDIGWFEYVFLIQAYM